METPQHESLSLDKVLQEINSIDVYAQDPNLTVEAREVNDIRRAELVEGLRFVGSVVTAALNREFFTATEVVTTPEIVITKETLLETFETGYRVYTGQIETINAARADHNTEARKADKVTMLELKSEDAVRSETEALLDRPGYLEELRDRVAQQHEMDVAAAKESAENNTAEYVAPSLPTPRINITPEQTTYTDTISVAYEEQNAFNDITGNTFKLYKRPKGYNDKRTAEATIAVAIPAGWMPEGTTEENKEWAKQQNEGKSASTVVSPTDIQALANMTGMRINYELNDSNTRYGDSYARRFDQKPVFGRVSSVCADSSGEVSLDGSFVGSFDPFHKSGLVLVV